MKNKQKSIVSLKEIKWLLTNSTRAKNFHHIKNLISNIENIEEFFTKNYQKRKKEGVFYTNKTFSDFVVSQVLLLLINKKCNKIGSNPLKLQKIDDLYHLIPQVKQEINKVLLKTTICDPACGAGGFLLSSVEIFFGIIIKLQPELNKRDVKKKLLSNIYGFDINKQAIDLSILKLFKWYFDEDCKDCNKIISNLITNFQVKNSLLNSHFSKFDLIIGNPPFGNILNQEEKRILKEENIFHRDVYCTFLIKALGWCNQIIGFIIPKSFLLRQGYIEFRNQLLSQADILKITDLGSKLFKNATNEVQVLLYANKKQHSIEDLSIYDYPEKHIITYKNQKVDSLRVCFNPQCPLFLKSKKLFVYTHEKTCPYCEFETTKLNRIRIKPKPYFAKLINKVEKKGDLNYLNPLSFPRMIRGEEDKGLKLVKQNLRNDNSGSCSFISARNDFSYYLIKSRKSFNIEEIDATKLKGNNFEYYTSPKLLIKHNNIIPEAIYSEENVCFTSSIYSLLHDNPTELKFLCSVFNSILIQFYCTYAINNQKNTTINLNQYMIRHIPIAKASEQIKTSLSKNVDKLLLLFKENRDDSFEKVKELIQEIDNIIFNLYSIDENEKKQIIFDMATQIKHFGNYY